MENKNYIWRPVSEYTGGRVLATNGLDVLIGEINSEGDCESEEDGSTILCGITGFIKIEEMLSELKESEDERIWKALIDGFKRYNDGSLFNGCLVREILAWLEKQKERSPLSKDEEYTLARIIEYLEDNDCPSEWKDLLHDIYALPYQIVKNPAWSEEDETALGDALWCCKQAASIAKNENDMGNVWYAETWLKSLKDRVQPQPKQEWSEEDENMIKRIKEYLNIAIGDLSNKLSGRIVTIGNSEYSSMMFEISKCISWLEVRLKSIRPQNTWKPSDAQMNTLEYYMHTLVCNEHKEILFGLYTDLKKLREE